MDRWARHQSGDYFSTVNNERLGCGD
ncbi:MAG: hypothetical protein R3F40_18275 [Candidatus Competibacteraceae bacterium]